MKRMITVLLLLSTLALLLPLFASCKKDGDAITLYVYNWGEYISDGSEDTLDVNAAFEEWYEETFGVKVEVNYSTFSSNEDMYAKLSGGASNYDVIVPSDYMIERMIAEGMLRKLNMQNIPNAQYIDTEVLFGGEAPYYDSEAAYSVPYTYGTIGIIYNTTMVEADDPSLGHHVEQKVRGQHPAIQQLTRRVCHGAVQARLQCQHRR